MEPGPVWEKYKALELWKRVLLIVPAILALALLALYILMKPQPTTAVDAMLEDYNDQVEENIDSSNNEIDRLIEDGVLLQRERENLKKEMKENEKIATDISYRIDSAGTLAELECIRRDVADRVRD